MFTGIISAIGVVTSIEEVAGGRKISVKVPGFFSESNIGDSVSNNGICLTITSCTPDHAEFFVQVETMDKTTLGIWVEGQKINLEHPLRLSDRLGGHLVQGHVDSTGEITNIQVLEDGSWRVTVEIPKEISKYVVEKGSITFNGVSLTVASKDFNKIDVALIPETLSKTTFGTSSVGDKVNIEVDAIARYVEQLFPGKE